MNTPREMYRRYHALWQMQDLKIQDLETRHFTPSPEDYAQLDHLFFILTHFRKCYPTLPEVKTLPMKKKRHCHYKRTYRTPKRYHAPCFLTSCKGNPFGKPRFCATCPRHIQSIIHANPSN